MNHVPALSKSVVMYLVIGCALLGPLLTQQALANGGDKTLRERIKERRADTQPDEVERIIKPGDYERRLQHEGISRRYRIHVPRGYNAAKAAPLVVAFHGGGGDMDYMAKDNYYGLISKSDAEGFVVVFPNGYSKFRSGKFATWNAGACCANARDKNIDDVGFVRS
jgi:polyhydroxybutyrate depolymerase